MTKSEELFHKIASELPGATEGKMFGALCIKAPNGKAGVMMKNDNIIIKLSGDDEKEALKLEGAQVFDPMGGRPMNGWIEIPAAHAASWKHFAETGMANAASIQVAGKKKKKRKKK